MKQPSEVPVTFVTKPPPPAPKGPVGDAARRATPPVGDARDPTRRATPPVDRRKADPDPDPRADNENGKEDFVPMLADKPSGLDLEDFLTVSAATR